MTIKITLSCSDYEANGPDGAQELVRLNHVPRQPINFSLIRSAVIVPRKGAVDFSRFMRRISQRQVGHSSQLQEDNSTELLLLFS